ncbi:MAG TPA: lytic transglycosylase domain-containing protein [Verrucomicrobiae bacterium]|nr:lytic transglycosylase domain-containing protein [Verrucomicrobiae bacterium]
MRHSWSGRCRSRSTKQFGFLVIAAAFVAVASAQEESFTIDADALQAVQQWAEENIDEDVLRSLGAADQKQVETFFKEIQKRFHGEYVVDVAELRDIAKGILPLLEANADTQAYAIWLKSRLDYLEVAEQLQFRITAPRGATNSVPRSQPIPSPQLEREVWIEKVSARPVPAAAAPYVKRLKPVFERHRLPPELVWIAEVESSFDPRAKSPAGAAGLFQLMPATAKQYGLKTWPLDQRYRPEESADAAARHLAYLYRRFKDWRLAVAAYNAGEGTVGRALERSRGKTFDAIANRLPAETRLYVPKVEAVLKRREGVQLVALHGPGR